MSNFTGSSSSFTDDGLAGVPLVDSHCHLQLSPLYERSDDAVKAAQQHASLRFTSVCGVMPGEDWGRIEALTQAHGSLVVPGFGLHPWWIRRFFDMHGGGNPLPSTALCSEAGAALCGTEDGAAKPFEPYALLERELREVLARHPAGCVGECGLDGGIKRQVHLEAQKAVFRKHLQVASDLQRAVVVHCVGVWGRLYEELQAAALTFPHIPAIILHSANSMNPELLPLFARNHPRVFFSFTAVGSAALGDEKQERRRQKAVKLVRAVPRRQLLLETDSPDQLPAVLRAAFASDSGGVTSPYAGLPYNEPAVIRHTCADIAAVLGVPVAELAELTTNNACRAFGMP